MSNKIIFIDFNTGTLLDEGGSQMLTLPSISYQAYPAWELHFVAFDSLQGVMLPVDISPAQSWQAAVDTDFDSSTDPMIRTLPSSIVSTGASSGVIIVPLNAGTTNFFNKVDKKNSIQAFFEVRGRDGDDRVLYDYRFRINALGAIDPQGGEPLPIESGGVTAADVYAIVNGNPQTLQNTENISQLSTEIDGKQDLITADDKLDYSLISGVPDFITSSILTSYQKNITSSDKLDYSLISGTPTIGSGTLTFTQGGVSLGSFNANATSSLIIDIPSGSDSGVTSGWVNGKILEHNESLTAHQNIISSKQDIINSSNKLDYSLLSGTPTIPTVNNPTITLTQGNIVKGTFTLNQTSGTTIDFDAGGGSGDGTRPLSTYTKTVLNANIAYDYLWGLLNDVGELYVPTSNFNGQARTWKMNIDINLSGSADVQLHGCSIRGSLSANYLNRCELIGNPHGNVLYPYDVTTAMPMIKSIYGSWTTKGQDSVTYSLAEGLYEWDNETQAYKNMTHSGWRIKIGGTNWRLECNTGEYYEEIGMGPEAEYEPFGDYGTNDWGTGLVGDSIFTLELYTNIFGNIE